MFPTVLLLLPYLLSAQDLPTVVVLSTGGTIASTHSDEEGGFTSSLRGEQLVAAVPGLGRVAEIEVQNVANVGSTNMTSALWLEVSRRAEAALERPEVAGVLVTHGTDTMEETAYFLDLTVAGPKPVILVGAMRAASEWDADGPRNLLDAARVAVTPEARGKGAFVVLNGEIHAAREVTKTHSLAVETFDTPQFGALGVVDPDGVHFYRAPLRRQTIEMPLEVTLPTVDIVPNYAGADGRLIRGLLKEGPPDGLVIDAAGAGNIATPLFEAVKEARERGIAVVITSRTHAGRVLPLYAGGGGGTTLHELGCVFADNLPAQKARVLLMAALTRTHDPEELREIFSR
ncbi:MAG: asparaginase [Longimicrobiales bacterium]